MYIHSTPQDITTMSPPPHKRPNGESTNPTPTHTPTNNQTTPPSASAAHRIFRTPELLELILLALASEHGPASSPLTNSLSMTALIHARQVSRHWRAVVDVSRALRRVLFLEPTGKLTESLFDVLKDTSTSAAADADVPYLGGVSTDLSTSSHVHINPLLQAGFGAEICGFLSPASSVADNRNTTHLSIPDWVPTAHYLAFFGTASSSPTSATSDPLDTDSDSPAAKRSIPFPWPLIWSSLHSSARTPLFADMLATQPPVARLLCRCGELVPGLLVCENGVRMRHLLLWRDAVVRVLEGEEKLWEPDEWKGLLVRVVDAANVDGRVVRDAVFLGERLLGEGADD
ncbi:uncharacterized protein K452DRAFT_362641 [Aplosporella prunicola CBS 121167]|uniref:F-box domain-containing protein n=1 Tax=Aplosporella prunicola CBS 121167 TaxID=1176127 RepID=A0A6A6AZ61_9PEZI|nr:uncharacterized protein K452DRAFT_362641 [Aplosporella prunicola CBS 121167]KAF2136294.1 hypothetical protein K452DRAFT_362641 [Aplosporella prunicola CBS 121167]